MSVIGFLLWLGFAVVVLITAALVMPLGIKIEAVLDGTIRWTFGLQPFGRFGPTIQLGKAKPKKRSLAKPGKDTAGKTSRGFRKPNLGRFPSAALQLVSALFQTIRLRHFSLDLKFGCADPADTGQLYGMLTPLLYGTSGSHRADLHVVPVFDGAMLKGRATLDLSLIPVRLAPPIIRFGWSIFGPRR